MVTHFFAYCFSLSFAVCRRLQFVKDTVCCFKVWLLYKISILKINNNVIEYVCLVCRLFWPFLYRLFKSSTTQRRSQLQHGYCIGVSRRSAYVYIWGGIVLVRGGCCLGGCCPGGVVRGGVVRGGDGRSPCRGYHTEGVRCPA